MTGAASESMGGLGFLRQLFGERQPAKPIAATVAVVDPNAEAAQVALARHGIRPTPEAYMLWYRHLAGERPDLSRRLKDLEARGEAFDAALIAELFERYFGGERDVEQVTSASQKVERLLAGLADELGCVEADAKSRGDRLGELGAALADADGGAASTARADKATATLRALVADVLEETTAMRMAAYRLQRRAVEGAGEIAQLRATIEAAGLDEAKDPVTGVAHQNELLLALRRAAAVLENESAAAAASGLCFLIVDLDDFRSFNHTHGRRLGDLVLKAAASQLALSIKRADTIGRLDGAAFGIVLVRADLAGAEALAARLCRLIADLRLEPGDTELGRNFTVPPVTVAIGVASYHRGEPLKRLIGRADRARQLAKEAGGNRAVSERVTTVVGRPKA